MGRFHLLYLQILLLHDRFDTFFSDFAATEPTLMLIENIVNLHLLKSPLVKSVNRQFHLFKFQQIVLIFNLLIFLRPSLSRLKMLMHEAKIVDKAIMLAFEDIFKFWLLHIGI